MPDNIPLLFDRPLLRRRLVRALAQWGAHDFLQREMALRLAERLAEVRRTFPRVLAVSQAGSALAQALSGHASIGACVTAHSIADASAAVALEEERLPFAPESFDAILSCGTLHLANDLPGALVQMKRALKPDGLLIAIFPGGETLSELRTVFTGASLAEEGGAAPRVHPCVDVRDGGALLQRAGFALPVADSERLSVRYESALALLQDIRGMGEASVLTHRARSPLKSATLLAMLEEYERRYSDAEGRVSATFELVTLTGWAPHSSQPKPLPRGSGQVNLTEVLR